MEASPVVTKHIQLILTEKEAMLLRVFMNRINGESHQETEFKNSLLNELEKATA
jgi:hypothetical protein